MGKNNELRMSKNNELRMGENNELKRITRIARIIID